MNNSIKIRKGNISQEPYIVLVTGKNSMGLWICEILNTNQTVFTRNDDDLVDFDYREFKVMYYKWHINNQDKVKANFISLLSEYEPFSET